MNNVSENTAVKPKSGYFTMVKLLLGYILRRDKSKSNGKNGKLVYGVYALLAFTYLMIAAFVVLMISLYTSLFVSYGMINEFITLILMAGLVFVLVFGVVAMLSNLYFSRDTEFFMSLPIKPGTVYMAKLTVIYVTELVTSALFLVPCLIALGVVAQMSALYYVTMLIAILLTPALPLFLASILAIPIMYIVSFFRKRGAAGSIVAIVLFGGLFALYYFFIVQFMNIPELGSLELSESLRNMFTVLANVFYPLYSLAKFATMTPSFGFNVGLSLLLNFLFFAVPIVVLGALALFISNLVYRKGAASQLESGKTKKMNADYTSSSELKALIKKEWRELIRTPAFAFQCLSGVILAPVVVGFMNIISSGNITGGDASVSALITSMTGFMSIAMISFIGISTNVGASTSITREGDKFYYMKLIPVPYKTQIRAKSYVYLLVAFATVVLSQIVSAVMHFDSFMFILGLLFLLIYSYGFVHFAILFDLSKPKLDWVTPNEATKNSRNAMVPMLINMAMSGLFIGISIVCTMFMGEAGILLAWILLFTIAITAAVVMHILLYKNCDKMIQKLG